MDYPQASSPALIVQHTGQVFPLTQATVTVGRHSDNIIVLADSQVSRHHAAISWQAGGYVVQDLGSANGTYVNERRISHPRPLRDGDVLRMGNTVFGVQLPPAAVEPGAGTMAVSPVPGGRSALPVVVGLLVAGIVIVGLAIVAILVYAALGGREPTVTIQSPTEGAQIVAGNEITLQATATGARNITFLELRVDDVLVTAVNSPDPEGASSLTVSQPWIFGQVGPHVVAAVAYTAREGVSEPASVYVTVVEGVGQVTPTAAPTATPAAGLLPDLVVSEVRIELETGGDCNYASTQLGVRVSIRNDGGADAGPFVVEVNGAQQTVAGGLATGQAASLWVPGNVHGGENVVVVDVNNQVQESNEDNNRFSQMVSVPTLPPTCTPPPPDVPTDTPTPTPTDTATPTDTPTPTPTPTNTPTPTPTPTPTETPPQYDLYVRRMDFSPNLVVGETIELHVMIATDIYPGGGPFFPASHFRWRQGPGFPWQEEVCPESAQYASCTKTVYFSYASAGDYYVEVEADSRNEVRETDETNNTSGWTLTVNPRTVIVNFEAFPDGTPIGSDRILNGDEFLAKGVRLEGAPAASSSCGGVATVPAIRRAQFGIAGNFLTTARPDSVIHCNFGPVGIRFTNPVSQVTLTFAGATATYVMEAYDGGGGFLGSVSQAAVAYGGTFEVTLSSTAANIARVTLGGPPGAVTAITQIVYDQ